MRGDYDAASPEVIGVMGPGGLLMEHIDLSEVTRLGNTYLILVCSLTECQVLHVHPTSVLFTRKPRSGWVVFHEMEETKKTQSVYPATNLTCFV